MSNQNPFLRSPFANLSDDMEDAEPANLPGQRATLDPLVIPQMQDTAEPAQRVPAMPDRPARATSSTGLLPPKELAPLFVEAAKKYNVPVNVLMALGHHESGYRADAIGQQTKYGTAKGMLQYLDDTAKGMGIDPSDPVQAIGAAAKQIRERLDKGMKMKDAVREHFAGPDRKQWGEKTRVYGTEVIGKAKEIAKMLMSEQGAAAGMTSTVDPKDANSMSQKMPRAQYEAVFMENNPNASPAAMAQAMAQYDQANPAKPAAPVDAGYTGMFKGMADKGKQASAIGQINKPNTLDDIDPSPEARTRRLIRGGMEGQTAQAVALDAAKKGIMPGRELGAGQTAGKTDFDFVTQKQFNSDPFYSHPLVRAGVKGWNGYRKGVHGLNEFVLENLGAQESAARSSAAASSARKDSQAIGEPTNYTQRMFEGAVQSIAQQTPALVGGAVTGSQALVLGSMFMQTFGTEYTDGRARGQDAGDATARAGLFGAAEVIGEKFGMGQTLKALRGSTSGMTTKDVSALLARALMKEIPGEQLTTLSQFGTDKIQGGIGLNTEAGMKQYLEQARDTLVQTVMQGGIMNAGASSIAAGRDMLTQPRTANEQIAREIERQVDEVNFVGTDAAARAALDPNNEAIDPATTRRPMPDPVPAEAAPAPQPEAPLTAAIETAAEATPQRVVVTRGEEQLAGELQAYQQDEAGRFTAQVLDDAGNVVMISDDGVTEIAPVLPEAPGPLSGALETVAAAQPEIIDAVPEIAEAAQVPAPAMPDAQPGAAVAAPEPGADVAVPAMDAAPAAPALIGSGFYGDGGKWGRLYKTVRRTDGTFAIVRATTDSDGTRIEHLRQDGSWMSGEPAKTTVFGAHSEENQAETFSSEEHAIAAAKDDLTDSGGAIEVAPAGAKPMLPAAPKTPSRASVAEMSDAELASRREYILKMAKQNGATKMTVEARNAVDREIKRRKTAAKTAAQPDEVPDAVSGKRSDDVGAGSGGKPVRVGAPDGTGLEGTGPVPVSGTGLAGRPAIEAGNDPIDASAPADAKPALKKGAAWQEKERKKEARLQAQIATAKANAEKRKGKPEQRASGGWVIRDKETGAAILETLDQKKVDALNKEKYEAVPVMQHLQEMNDPESKVRKHAEGPAQDAAPAKAERGVVRTSDGKEFKPSEAKLVGSVSKVSGRDVHKPAVVGEFPVFVEQSGNYRLFTYNKKIESIDGAEEVAPTSDPQATTKPKVKKPTPKARAAERERLLSDRFTPGNVIKSYSGNDRVISYEPASEENGFRFTVKVQAVEQKDGAWVDVAGEVPRNHSTMPSERELKDGPIERAKAEADAAIKKAAEPDAEDAPAFSVKGINRDLVITHNLTEENLLHAQKMGGIAVPSLAVTKKDSALTGFGDITLIGSRAMADPKGYAGTKVFGADIYSPRYPSIEHKLDRVALKKINALLANAREAIGGREFYGDDLRTARDLSDSTAVRYQTLLDAGITIEPTKRADGTIDAWATDNLVRRALGDANLYGASERKANELLAAAGAEERIFQGYTNGGTRRYVPHTLDNVVKILKKELRGGEGFTYGVGSVRALYTAQFKTVKAMQQAKDRLVSKDQFEKVKAEIQNDFDAVGSDLRTYHPASDSYGFSDTVVLTMQDAAKMGVPRALEANGFKDVPREVQAHMAGFLSKLAHMPTEYFEAKILREVDVAEFTGAVIPSNASQEVRDLLTSRGVPFKEYTGEAQRANAVKEFADELDASKGDVLFSTKAAANGTMTAATLREKLANGRQFGSVIDSLIESGQVVLHDTAATLPGALKGREGVQAVTMPNGTIHMVASNLTPRNARAVLMHEAFHAGAEALIGGKAWTALMGKLASLSRQAKSTNGAANAFWKAAQQRVEDARAQDAVTPQMELEEFGAYAIEEYESAPPTVKKWVDDLVGAVKAWLVARFGKQMGDVTPAQLSAMARMALRDAVAERSGAMQEAFSKGGQRTIEVDGVRRPITNSKGQSLGDTFAKQKAFWNWAGDTKVVDEQGRPMVVYHGTTKDFAAFDASRLGENTKHITAKMGFFFSPAPEVTDIFTETIDETQWPFKLTSKDGASTMPVYLNIKNPLEMTVASFRELEPWTRAELAAKGYDGVRIIGDPKLAGTYGGDEWKVDTWVALNPEQVKSATGNSGEFDGNNPDIRFSVAGAAPAGAQSGANADTGLTPNDTKWTDMLRRVQATVQDNMNRVKQVQERIEKLTGQKLSELTDYYRAETNRPGRIAARLEDGERGLFKPLMEKLAKAGHTPAQLEELLHAMHAAERNETVARINPEEPHGSGMTDEKAAEILKQYEGEEFETLHALADDARAIARTTLEAKFAYGLLTPERFEQLTTHYEFYVPLKGDGEYGPKVKQAMGHGERDEFILQNIVRDFKQAIIVGEKNQARQYLLRMVLKNPDAKLWTVGVPPKGRYVAGKVYTIKRNGDTVATLTSQAEVTGFLEGKGREASQYQVVDSAGMQVAEFTKPLQDNEVIVYIKGDAVRIQVNDEKLASQLRPLNTDQMNAVLRFSGALNRWYSKVYTGYNPAFILRNAARDAGTGTINMLGNYGGKTAAGAWARYPQAIAALGYWATTGKFPNTKSGNLLREYRNMGGKVGASHMGDLEAQGESLQAMYDNAAGLYRTAKTGSARRTAAVAWHKTIGQLAHVVEIANQSTENALRLALYMELKAQGASPAKAAQAAKTVTVDFDRKGASTPALSAAYLFFNPAVQGTANGIKTLAKGAHREQAWAAVGGLAVLGFWLASRGMDDDKDRWLGEKWDIRTKNFRIDAGDVTVNIPVSQEFAPFYAFGVGAAEAMRGENKASTSLRVASSLMDAYVPFRGLYEPDSDNHGMDVLLALMPTLGQMPTQIATNRNSFGGSIVPDSPFTKDRPDNLKMGKGTKNSVYDKAAQGIAAAGVATGYADKYENDMTKVSPETLKLLWANFAGGLGTFVADVSSNTAMAIEEPGQITKTDVPIVKDFIKPKDVKALRGRYYSLTKEARKVIAEIESAKKAKDADEMAAIRDDPEKSELVRMGKLIKKTTQAAGAKRDEAVDITADTELTGPQKRTALKALDIEEQELYRDAIEAFKK